MSRVWKYKTSKVRIDLGKGQFVEGETPSVESNNFTSIKEVGGNTDSVSYSYRNDMDNIEFEFWVMRMPEKLNGARRVGIGTALSRLARQKSDVTVTPELIRCITSEIEEALLCISKNDQRKTPSILSMYPLVFEISTFNSWPEIQSQFDIGRYI